MPAVGICSRSLTYHRWSRATSQRWPEPGSCSITQIRGGFDAGTAACCTAAPAPIVNTSRAPASFVRAHKNRISTAPSLVLGMLCRSWRLPTQLSSETCSAIPERRDEEDECHGDHAAPEGHSTQPRDALPAMIAFNFVPKIIVAVADRVLPACFKGRLSPEYDAEQQAGDDGCSDLLSATQRRVSSKDGRRSVAEPCLPRHSSTGSALCAEVDSTKLLCTCPHWPPT